MHGGAADAVRQCRALLQCGANVVRHAALQQARECGGPACRAEKLCCFPAEGSPPAGAIRGHVRGGEGIANVCGVAVMCAQGMRLKALLKNYAARCGVPAQMAGVSRRR